MSFQGILGHDRAIGVLKQAIAAGKVAHAHLFAGPDGIGKKLVARAFALALNCSAGGGDACGACGDCVAMCAGTHPNLLEVGPVDADGEPDELGLVRIGQVREVQGALRYKAERGMKAVIIDRADRLMPAAANAFLKTLEEPPGDSVIILISSKPAELLPTVLSRCHRINFRPLPEETVRAFLIEKKGVAPAEAGAVARLSEGSLSRASAYIDDGAHHKGRAVIERLSALGPDDADEALKFAEELSKRDDLDEMLDFLKSWYRDRIVALEGAAHLIANIDMQRQMKDNRVEGFNRLRSAFQAVEEAKKNISPPRYGNKQLTLEALMLRLSGAHSM
ncbi:MAG TPA: DNA polymerase III subunit delta' [Deltaproteobacteria bacterium]|nr:MAG: DNA polymerase III subunit delta' [Deltaproteobacteria bacterium GWA2_55_82]OGQ63743.1 MAG: DNA polymerase III subunit delta' [Deltaproteobacteria bacterium RIFCSPLOWO2_02_FULL_55_12]OIJ73466.1 MAG: DNA polymerase III subunit delta' [Deltaproteobacteria bacterium GWC2_55_46]HBG47332.1 DNA polymerase III subunit delta' [Deltaproteobacteria bacterium]HCY10098.1 DNA polymerase III subunit delta' [Deltaproteobacteria bacterium]